MAEAMHEEVMPRSFESKVLGVAGSVRGRSEGGPMGRGDRAVLRRMLADATLPPEPFWALVAKYDIHEKEEEFWRVAMPLMVLHPHRPGISAGRALAAARTTGPRVERWLRLDRERARQEANRLLARIDGGFDWVRFARLLRSWSRASKLTFARDFYLSNEYRSATSGETPEGEQ